MSFRKFKDWMESNKWTSSFLILLFCAGAIFQFSDLFKRTISIIHGGSSFEIVSTEVSHKHSVYRDIEKLDERMQSWFTPTPFIKVGDYRQIVRDDSFVDNVFQNRSQEIPALLLMVVAFALDNDMEMDEETRKFFKLIDAEGSDDEIIDFLFSMIPRRRFVPLDLPSSTDRKSIPFDYEPFLPESNDASRVFHKALDAMWSSDASKKYRLRHIEISRSLLEAHLDEYYALFKLGFYPVFEVTLYNDGMKNILIKSVGAEVVDIYGYKGGAEYIPTTDIISIPVEDKIGEYWKELKNPIIINSGGYLRLIVRLEPQEKEASYLIKLKIKGGDIVRESEIFATTM